MKKYLIEYTNYADLEIKMYMILKNGVKHLVHPIHKKGNTQNQENYRPIPLLCITYKLLAKLIQEDIERENRTIPSGFYKWKVSNKSYFCTDNETDPGKMRKEKYFKQASNKINRKNIFEAMKSLNIPTEFI